MWTLSGADRVPYLIKKSILDRVPYLPDRVPFMYCSVDNIGYSISLLFYLLDRALYFSCSVMKIGYPTLSYIGYSIYSLLRPR